MMDFRRRALCLVALTFLMLALAVPVAGPPALAGGPAIDGRYEKGVWGIAPVPPAAERGATTLQFTSGGHVLGFAEDGVIIASGSHMLKTGFVDANAVAPQADEASEETGDGREIVSRPDGLDLNPPESPFSKGGFRGIQGDLRRPPQPRPSSASPMRIYGTA